MLRPPLAFALCCATLAAERQFDEQLREYMPRLALDCRALSSGDGDGDGSRWCARRGRAR